MALDLYRKKRNFRNTPEPRGEVRRAAGKPLAYVIQKHAASHLHYDFRLELDGVLLSWAVPKGPSLDPSEKRLAMHVEDHPVDYGGFEGVIPPGQYGSGTVMLWDRGHWIPDGDAREGHRKGRLKFTLEGEKLGGGWMLVKSRGSKFGGEKAWLLFKLEDEWAQPVAEGRVTEEHPDSVASKRTMEEIARDKDRVWGSRKAAARARAPSKAAAAKKGKGAAKLPPEGAPRFAKPAAGTVEVSGVAISNPNKLLYPDAGIRKVELAEYYAAVGEWIVPHLEDRPLALVRCPDGWNQSCFFQKNAPQKIHRAITPVAVDTSEGEAIYMMANNTTAVVALLQSGALEFHPWGSRSPKLGRPDRIVFDFDPDKGIAYSKVADAARLVRDLLEHLGLQSFVKTTGGKGLHVVVPIQATHDWPTIKAFSRAIAESLALTYPEQYTSEASKAKRKGRLFVDYLRNGEGATAVAAYSLRARENAPVAMPVDWDDLAKDLRFDHFNVKTVAAHLARRRSDPWREFFRVKQRVTAAMLAKVGVGR